MKTIFRVLVLCCLSVMPVLASAQMSTPMRPAVGSQVPPAQVYGRILSSLEREIVGLADAMPEEKYNFVPEQGEYKGVHNFSQQVKHIAEANYEFFGKMANADPSAPAAIEN